MLTTIVSFIIVLSILVFFHELGHYLVAKHVGVQVEEFAIGMGPKLVGKQVGETLYSLRMLPLGGFCKLTGEMPVEEEEATEEEIKAYQQALDKGKCLFQKSIGERIGVLSMGPVMNFVLAIILFALVFSIFGVPVSVSSTTQIGQVVPEKPAAKAGLQEGDRILAIDGTSVEKWKEAAEIIHDSAGEKLNLTIKRGEKTFQVQVTPELNSRSQTGMIGIFPVYERQSVNPLRAVWLGILQTIDYIKLIVLELGRMFTGTREVQLSGPVKIAELIGDATQRGLLRLFRLSAVISINLGIINLLPLPALDGGRLVFLGIEWVRGEPVDPEKEGLVHLIGFVLLIILIVVITVNDLTS